MYPKGPTRVNKGLTYFKVNEDDGIHYINIVVVKQQ